MDRTQSDGRLSLNSLMKISGTEALVLIEDEPRARVYLYQTADFATMQYLRIALTVALRVGQWEYWTFCVSERHRLRELSLQRVRWAV